jgi:hypothetical protein
MRVLLLTITLAGCSTIQQGWLDAEQPRAQIVLDGSVIISMSATATLTGPIQEGAPYTINGAVINDLDWTVLDTPQLTVGDQVWSADGDGAVWAVDTRTDAPQSLLAMCGRQVYFQFTFGTTMYDGHQEGAGAIVEPYVECFD